MDSLILPIFVVLFPLTIVAIVIGILFLIYSWLAKRGYKAVALIICFSIIGFLALQVYLAICPPDDFYKADFEYEANLKLPKSGDIIAKDVSFPDFQNQYTSDALIQLSDSDYRLLFSITDKDHKFDTDVWIGNHSQYFYKVTKGFNRNNIIRITKKGRMYIGFFNDNRTVIAERAPYVLP